MSHLMYDLLKEIRITLNVLFAQENKKEKYKLQKLK